MKIKMDSLVITEYCSNDKRKIRFVKEISEDQLVNYFVSGTLKEQIESSEGNENLQVGPAYIIEEQRKLIGIIRLASINKEGSLYLHYAVHPDYRRQHYGTKLLKETSEYLLKNNKDITKIELHIKDVNNGSIRCAEKSGFSLEKKDGAVKIYSKRKNN